MIDLVEAARGLATEQDDQKHQIYNWMLRNCAAEIESLRVDVRRLRGASCTCYLDLEKHVCVQCARILQAKREASP